MDPVFGKPVTARHDTGQIGSMLMPHLRIQVGVTIERPFLPRVVDGVFMDIWALFLPLSPPLPQRGEVRGSFEPVYLASVGTSNVVPYAS